MAKSKNLIESIRNAIEPESTRAEREWYNNLSQEQKDQLANQNIGRGLAYLMRFNLIGFFFGENGKGR